MALNPAGARTPDVARPPPGPHTTLRLGLLLAGLSAVLFSGKAVVAKLIYRAGGDALQVIALRMSYALPLLLLGAWWAGRRGPALGWRTHRRLALLGALGYWLSSLLDFAGLQYVSVGLERLTLFLGPAIVLVLGQLFFGRPTTPRQWLAMAIAYTGVALVFQHDVALGGDHVVLGTGLVFGAALSYSLYLLLAGDLVRQLGSLKLVSWALLYSTALALLQFVCLRSPAELLALPAAVHGWSLVNALLCTAIPVWCTMQAVALIGPALTAQMGMLGPVSLLPLGHFVLGESLGWTQLAGTALVLGGIGVLARLPAPPSHSKQD